MHLTANNSWSTVTIVTADVTADGTTALGNIWKKVPTHIRNTVLTQQRFDIYIDCLIWFANKHHFLPNWKYFKTSISIFKWIQILICKKIIENRKALVNSTRKTTELWSPVMRNFPPVKSLCWKQFKMVLLLLPLESSMISMPTSKSIQHVNITYREDFPSNQTNEYAVLVRIAI